VDAAAVSSVGLMTRLEGVERARVLEAFRSLEARRPRRSSAWVISGEQSDGSGLSVERGNGMKRQTNLRGCRHP